LRNGELLDAAEAAKFDVFVTTDKNIRYHQNLSGRKIAIVSGAWVFKRTRTPVAVVFENLEDGRSIDQVIEQFPVSQER